MRFRAKHVLDDVNVYEAAKARIHDLYDRYDTVAVSFSGGKDSTAVLGVVTDVARERGAGPVLVDFWDEECIPPETIEYVERTRQRPDIKLRWWCLPLKHLNTCSPKHGHWYPWHPDDEEKWVRPLPPHAITWSDVPNYVPGEISDACHIWYPPELGRVAMCLGIRTEESHARYSTLVRRNTDNYLMPVHSAPWVTKANVIYDWKTNDVWLGPKTLGWDYNQSYDVMHKVGVNLRDQRIAPPFGEQPMKSLWQFRECWPDLWARMVDRVPGANTAAQHANNVLYGGGGKAFTKPDGVSWEHAIRQAIKKHDPEDGRKVAKKIQSLIKYHNKNTGRSLPDQEPDPDSGISWALLYKIAVNGDFKGRITQHTLIAPKTNPREREDSA